MKYIIRVQESARQLTTTTWKMKKLDILFSQKSYKKIQKKYKQIFKLSIELPQNFSHSNRDGGYHQHHLNIVRLAGLSLSISINFTHP